MKSRAKTRKQMRMNIIIAGMAMLCVAVGLGLLATKDNITFFVNPSELAERNFEPGQKFRLGGLVEEGSLSYSDDGVTALFKVTDLNESIPTVYSGILPDLFREGQGVVALGKLSSNGTFEASEVLAKHDENYMPAEAVDAMKRAGTWQHNEEQE